jgi:hypothetical protein
VQVALDDLDTATDCTSCCACLPAMRKLLDAHPQALEAMELALREGTWVQRPCVDPVRQLNL